MAYLVDQLLVPGFRNVDLGGGFFSYTFIFQISSADLLPPGAYCALLSKFAPIISNYHSIASMWVQVDSPGLWFPLEIRRGLRKLPIPVAVTRKDSPLNFADFNIRPFTTVNLLPHPPLEPDWVKPVSANELACLRVLARSNLASTLEIASLVGIHKSTALEALKKLAAKGLICHAMPPSWNGISKIGDPRRYPYWDLKQSGLITALRSWGVPPGFRFTSRMEAAHGEANRHITTSRLWPASLKKDLGGGGEIWAGWTEVGLTDVRSTPDALAWGRVDECETLFWLEVESGHASTKDLIAKLLRRFQAASHYAREREINLVFAVLGRPWVQRAVRKAFNDMEPNVAVIIGDWKTFGHLPVIEWGRVHAAGD